MQIGFGVSPLRRLRVRPKASLNSSHTLASPEGSDTVGVREPGGYRKLRAPGAPRGSSALRYPTFASSATRPFDP